MKTPQTITLKYADSIERYDPITDTYTGSETRLVEIPCLANYLSQERIFELYGDRTNRVLVVRFNQEQVPFKEAIYQGRTFVPIESIDAPIKGAVRLKEVAADE
ncbi:hypothetical protein [Facklamia hominis]|uniref:Uncharacterized protein n=1 Tax=Facklamia hominis TaxID=178214 RepID=A0AAJ1Q5Q2_9LACT|nr:hypothetical protein [Facklamia hominis]MDK7187930.1 hypothetical protein [Facklamia hominis]